MTFMELAKSHYSVRKFMDKPVEDEKLAAILEAGKVAPTACNNQPQKIFVVKSEEMREKLRAVCKCTFGAPVIFVICYDETLSWKNRLMPGYQSGETDAAIVCTHMMLEAWELGIGSCWVGMFNSDQVWGCRRDCAYPPSSLPVIPQRMPHRWPSTPPIAPTRRCSPFCKDHDP